MAENRSSGPSWWLLTLSVVSVLSCAGVGWLVYSRDDQAGLAEAATVAGALLVALFTVFLTWFQSAGVRELRHSVEDQRESVRMARAAVQVARDTLEVSHRAWVMISRMDPQNREKDGFTTPLAVSIKNFGNVPATNVELVVMYETLDPSDGRLREAIAFDARAKGLVLAPGQEVTQRLSGDRSRASGSSGERHFCHGAISYRDIHDTPRLTTFRARWEYDKLLDRRFVFESEGNTAS